MAWQAVCTPKSLQGCHWLVVGFYRWGCTMQNPRAAARRYSCEAAEPGPSIAPVRRGDGGILGESADHLLRRNLPSGHQSAYGGQPSLSVLCGNWSLSTHEALRVRGQWDASPAGDGSDRRYETRKIDQASGTSFRGRHFA